MQEDARLLVDEACHVAAGDGEAIGALPKQEVVVDRDALVRCAIRVVLPCKSPERPGAGAHNVKGGGRGRRSTTCYK